MDVSPNVLRKETVAVYLAANDLLKEDLTPNLKATLLSTKAQCLNTLVLLNDKR